MAICQLHKTLLHHFFSNDFNTINPFNILIMKFKNTLTTID